MKIRFVTTTVKKNIVIKKPIDKKMKLLLILGLLGLLGIAIYLLV